VLYLQLQSSLMAQEESFVFALSFIFKYASIGFVLKIRKPSANF
jgi:hypothetical protein